MTTGPLPIAATTSCVAAMATMIGMYIDDQNATPPVTPVREPAASHQDGTGGDQGDHREADPADVGLDAEQPAEPLADEGADAACRRRAGRRRR